MPFGDTETDIYFVMTVDHKGEPHLEVFMSESEQLACYAEKEQMVKRHELTAAKRTVYTILATVGWGGGGQRRRKEQQP